MRAIVAITLAVLLSHSQIERLRKPERPLEPLNPRSLAEHALYNTRSLDGYETRYGAKITPPLGDALEYTGRSVWVSPGVLYVRYTGSGGSLENIVRIGDKVRIFNPRVDAWMSSDEQPVASAGRGFQNPEEVMEFLSRHLSGAQLSADGAVELAFSGKELKGVVQERANPGAYDWAKSKAQVRIQVDAKTTRVKSVTCAAELVSADPGMMGKIQYAAEMEISSTGVKELQFLDDRNQPIPLDEETRKEIDRIRRSR